MTLPDIGIHLPITDPTWIFFLVLMIILFAPIVLGRLRIPHIIGMILAGVVIGKYGFNILERDSSFELFGKVEDDGYVLYVRDHGRGMPKEELNRITEPFYMIDKSRSRAQNGAGLGLALCQRIAELHDSTLEFDSEPGKGTTVRLFLPGGVSA